MKLINFTEEHQIFREKLKEFLAEYVIPNIEQYEENHVVPKEIWQKMGQRGLLCSMVPSEYGGMGEDFLYAMILTEEITKSSCSGLFASLHSDIVVPYILSFGSDEQKKKYLPGCVSGDIITAVAMTEPDAGSDLASMTTTAVKDGDEIIINGTKTFISNALNCDLVVVAATDPSVENKHQALSLFLVEADTPGFTRGEPLDKMGLKGQDTGELFFTNCRIPNENQLGQDGGGFSMLMDKLQQERLVCAMGSLFLAEFMVEWITDYCKKTIGDGNPLIRSQSTQFSIVEMETEIRLARAFLEKLIVGHMAGENVIIDISMAKYWISETANKIAHKCLDLTGAYGTLEECPLARTFRDVRVYSIFAGTNEIMKNIAAKLMGM